MPTVNQVIGGILQNAIAHPKSTAQSILTTGFAVTGYLMASSAIKPKTAAIALAVNGICKIGLGMLQTDGINVPPGSKINQVSESASDGSKSSSSTVTKIEVPPIAPKV